ncbi:hypothetical protein [Paenibacillus sp. 481]|uniref:hypothetical protein n=1 Tax=Paenibacillus sp. 481 TaxID=2835869 RepID=UPI001E63FF6B|nr:hypothetical protein [Paenibacillus sp. 481]UHA72166.1 hypothetical protein KIK04_15835 [Paenibacillus sp. 481]
MMKISAKYVGIASSLGILSFLFIFCYANPYNNEFEMDWVKQRNILFVLGLPAVINLLSIIFNRFVLNLVTLVWLSPFMFYVGLSKIPSLWNWFAFFTLIQIVTLFFLKKKKKKKMNM